MDLNFILKNRDRILQKAYAFGFEDIKLNTNFEEGLLFIVKKGNHPKASVHYAVFLRKSLESMLGCQMTVNEQTELRTKCCEKILQESVSLRIGNEKILQFLSSKGIKSTDVTFPETKFSEEEQAFHRLQEEEIQKILTGQIGINKELRNFLPSFYRRKRPASHLEIEESRNQLIAEMLAGENKEVIQKTLQILPETTFNEVYTGFKKARQTKTIVVDEPSLRNGWTF